jgi:hypothetical protein
MPRHRVIAAESLSSASVPMGFCPTIPASLTLSPETVHEDMLSESVCHDVLCAFFIASGRLHRKSEVGGKPVATSLIPPSHCGPIGGDRPDSAQ